MSRLRPATVRAQITALATLVAAVVLIGAAWLLIDVLDSQVTEQSDGALRARALELADLAEAGTLAPEPQPVTDEGLVQIVSSDSRVLAASANLRDAPPIASPDTTAEDLRVAEISAPDDEETEQYRVWRVSRQTPDGLVTVYAGISLESGNEATRTLRRLLFVGVPLMLLLLGVGIWYVVGRALARVERVRRAVDCLGEGDLSRRLEPGPPDEVGRLVATLNAMLDRIERGQQRQRDFVADASHELQSPVTAFRTQLEVAQALPHGTDWSGLVADLLDDTDRMQVLVRDLLLLAASESSMPVSHSVDLRGLVEAEVARSSAAGPGVRLVDGPSPVVTADHDGLARVVRNLLDNAVQHARGQVVVEVETDGAQGVVRVSDDGPGVPPEHRELVFDRFHRVDTARSRAGRGTGLGLAIARSVARSHGGDVVLVPSEVGAVFELRLPLAGAGGR